MDLKKEIKLEIGQTLDRLKEKPLLASLQDILVSSISHVKIGNSFARFVKQQGLSESIATLQRYPWLKEFVTYAEFLFIKMVSRRTGPYREANAMVLEMVLDSISEDVSAIVSNPSLVVLHEDMVPNQILHAMGLKPWMAEFMGMLMPLVYSQIPQAYIDASENAGIAADTCSLPKTTMGMTLLRQMPEPVVMVASNLPCDGGMASYTVMERALKVPTYQLDIPHHFKSERALEYFVNELRGMIKWLEMHTPGKMDWDLLRAICERHNEAKELELELWDLMRTRPSPMAGEPIIYGHLFAMQFNSGTRKAVDYNRKLLDLAYKIRDSGKGALVEERYRALLWNPTTPCFPDLYNWAEETYGIAFLMDMMSYQQQGYIDTSNEDSMLRGLAQFTMEGPMARHTRGPVENFFTDLFNAYEQFDLDMIFMAEHVGCKNTKALNGMFRELCRERKIPVFFLQYDLCDSRISTPENMKKQVETFMESIMKAERLTKRKTQ